jgi:hypothetical protein
MHLVRHPATISALLPPMYPFSDQYNIHVSILHSSGLFMNKTESPLPNAEITCVLFFLTDLTCVLCADRLTACKHFVPPVLFMNKIKYPLLSASITWPYLCVLG